MRSRLGLLFPLRFGAQGGDFRFQVGQAALHRGGARFGVWRVFGGLDHFLADALRARREERAAVLARQVAQPARPAAGSWPISTAKIAFFALGFARCGLFLGHGAEDRRQPSRGPAPSEQVLMKHASCRAPPQDRFRDLARPAHRYRGPGWREPFHIAGELAPWPPARPRRPARARRQFRRPRAPATVCAIAPVPDRLRPAPRAWRPRIRPSWPRRVHALARPVSGRPRWLRSAGQHLLQRLEEHRLQIEIEQYHQHKGGHGFQQKPAQCVQSGFHESTRIRRSIT